MASSAVLSGEGRVGGDAGVEDGSVDVWIGIPRASCAPRLRRLRAEAPWPPVLAAVFGRAVGATAQAAFAAGLSLCAPSSIEPPSPNYHPSRRNLHRDNRYPTTTHTTSNSTPPPCLTPTTARPSPSSSLLVSALSFRPSVERSNPVLTLNPLLTAGTSSPHQVPRRPRATPLPGLAPCSSADCALE